MNTLPGRYLAMALVDPASHALEQIDRELVMPTGSQVLLRVSTCGVCRTDLHIVDGDLTPSHLPRVPGHEVVGVVAALGPGCMRFRLGDRLGVPWLYGSCGHCACCAGGRENLCADATFTGFSADGGYAEYVLADESYCFLLPDRYSDEQAAPLLCAGLIGYRALRMAGDARRLGIYGFGAAGHLIAQVALAQGRTVFAFTRPGDLAAQTLARALGVHWAGGSDQAPPQDMDAAILFAPAGELVPAALGRLERGGVVVCAGIHMSDIPSFPYSLLWGERCVRSVANLTRRDGDEFFAWAAVHELRLSVETFPLRDANRALQKLRAGDIVGAAVLRCAPGAL
jgi:propanol-preferring alcohol dehydrogenase